MQIEVRNYIEAHMYILAFYTLIPYIYISIRKYSICPGKSIHYPVNCLVGFMEPSKALQHQPRQWVWVGEVVRWWGVRKSLYSDNRQHLLTVPGPAFPRTATGSSAGVRPVSLSQLPALPAPAELSSFIKKQTRWDIAPYSSILSPSYTINL